MPRILLSFLIFFLLISCGARKKSRVNADAIKLKFASRIVKSELDTKVYILASDVFEGRKTGEKGQKLAASYIADYYDHIGILSPKGYDNYFQEIPIDFFKNQSKSTSENVIAYIPGSKFSEEFVVISSHYDHLGKKGDNIYYGADDDASGTAAVMQIAKAFQDAYKAGYGPKRSIVFLNFTGEEQGLFGSKYYTSHPIFPLENTIVNLNIDMIGRVDEKHEEKQEYIYLIGSDRLSKDLHKLSESINKKFTKLTLDYTYNEESDPNRYYYRSDHYNFAKNNIPVIFYFNGSHKDYHRSSDTPDKINYELLAKRARFIFYTAWEIANKDKRLVIDEK